MAGGGSRIATIAPVVERSGVHFAALGLMQMLNGGGAVTSCSLVPVQALANDNAARWLGPLLKPPASKSYAGSNGAGGKQESGNGSTPAGVAALVRFPFTLQLRHQKSPFKEAHQRLCIAAKSFSPRFCSCRDHILGQQDVSCLLSLERQGKTEQLWHEVKADGLLLKRVLHAGDDGLTGCVFCGCR